MFDLKDIVTGGFLVGLAIAITAFLAGDAVNPNVPENVGLTPAEPRLCPPSWADTSSRDEHTIVLSCSKDGWLVILQPSGAFSYALPPDASRFVFDAKEVRGWPVTSSPTP
jgi:hypothetical protein